MAAGSGYRITINDREAIEALSTQMAMASDKALGYIAQDVWGGIKKEAPKDHGRMAGSFTLERESSYRHKIRAGVEYALFVHEGTGIYGPNRSPILPKNASRLVFSWKGQMWHLRSVKGQEANPFADRAMTATEARVPEFISRALAETPGMA